MVDRDQPPMSNANRSASVDSMASEQYESLEEVSTRRERETSIESKAAASLLHLFSIQANKSEVGFFVKLG